MAMSKADLTDVYLPVHSGSDAMILLEKGNVIRFYVGIAAPAADTVNYATIHLGLTTPPQMADRSFYAYQGTETVYMRKSPGEATASVRVIPKI